MYTTQPTRKKTNCKKETALTKHLDIAKFKTSSECVLYGNHLARHGTIKAMDYILRLRIWCWAISTKSSWIFSIHIIAYKDLNILPKKSTTYNTLTFGLIWEMWSTTSSCKSSGHNYHWSTPCPQKVIQTVFVITLQISIKCDRYLQLHTINDEQYVLKLALKIHLHVNTSI